MYQEYSGFFCTQTADLRKIKTLVEQRTYRVTKIAIFKQKDLESYQK
jgi:hypothetical protein